MNHRSMPGKCASSAAWPAYTASSPPNPTVVSRQTRTTVASAATAATDATSAAVLCRDTNAATATVLVRRAAKSLLPSLCMPDLTPTPLGCGSTCHGAWVPGRRWSASFEREQGGHGLDAGHAGRGRPRVATDRDRRRGVHRGTDATGSGVG